MSLEEGEVDVDGGDAERGMPLEEGEVDVDGGGAERFEEGEVDAIVPLDGNPEGFDEDMSISSDCQNENRASLNDDAETVRVQQQFIITKSSVTNSHENGPSIQITYKQITRESRRKLQDLMWEWADWQKKQVSSGGVLESGTETYFPVVGNDPANISTNFWMDKPVQGGHDVPELESHAETPFYDRGYHPLMQDFRPHEGDGCWRSRNLELPEEASRCFNCGSYSHVLKDCPRPRDHVYINSARKLHSSKRGQQLTPASVRGSARYYQKPKFNDIKPGILGTETRVSLGIGESDPPPWLNRMRELGYPPGYLGSAEEEEPSGIFIYGEDGNQFKEDGEILEETPPAKRKRVEFPGVNSPVPSNANMLLWSDARTDNFSHPDDGLKPPGVSSSYDRSSSRYSPVSSHSSRERQEAWESAHAAIQSVKSRSSNRNR